jgi:hypothetical protein
VTAEITVFHSLSTIVGILYDDAMRHPPCCNECLGAFQAGGDACMSVVEIFQQR